MCIRDRPDIDPNKRTSCHGDHRRSGLRIFGTPCGEMGDQFGEYEAASMHSPLLSIVVNGMLTGCRGLILAISIQIVPDRTSRYPVHAKGLIRFRKVLYRTLVVQHHLGHQVAASLQDAAMYDHVAIH